MENPFEILINKINEMQSTINKLVELQATQRPVEDADEIGNMELAERITGLKKATIYCKVCKNEIPHFKRGGRIYFSKKDLLDWITECGHGSPPQAQKTLVQLPQLLFPRHRNNKNSIIKNLKNYKL